MCAACEFRGAYMRHSRKGTFSPISAREAGRSGSPAHTDRNSTRRMAPSCGFKPTGLRARNGKTMKTTHQTPPVGGMQRLGTVFIRMAVGLLLGSAITVAVVAAGLDLFPLRP